jgi:hypothetical protein
MCWSARIARRCGSALLLASLAVVLAVVLAGCGAPAQAVSTTGSGSVARSSGSPPERGGSEGQARGSKVLLIVLENHGASQALQHMPFLASQGRPYAEAAHSIEFSNPVERQACRRFDVPAGTMTHGAFVRDVSRGDLPTVGMLVPNMCHNGHNCSLATADRWLRHRVRAVEAGPDFRSGRLTVVVTFDEDDYRSGNHVLTVC